ncbi:DUF2070 family protein [Candidatus Bathyarchaeota archaeon]|nr:DUF2070 family protein [Candidatus Bathyarchaeota archaeon]
MADSISLNHHLDRAAKHYSSLFRLPSYKRIVQLLALLCMASSFLSTFSFTPPSLWLTYGLLLGFAFFSITLLTNYFLAMFVSKEDPIYDLRRTAALSMFCWAFWLLFIVMGCAVAFFTAFSHWAVRFSLLGFSAVLIFRIIVLYSTSSMNFQRFLLASIFQPFLCLMPFVFLWWLNNANITFALGFSVIALVIALASSFSFIFLLNFIGKRSLGEQSIPIFRAFLMNWVADLNAPFESFLERLSEQYNVEVSIIRFDSSKSNVFIVVPSVHPGPFKNVGSSLLPFMLKKALEQKFGGVACVPLGLLGHELDAASQSQVQKIIAGTLESADFTAKEVKATPFIKASNGLATVCCQVFGKTALISFSLAPKTTEDFPQELGDAVRKEAVKLGFESCVTINAHNSINGIVDMQTALDALKNAAVNCLKEGVSARVTSFKVGAATVLPKEFSVEDGMGSGGITVLAVETGSQKAAYVIVDGNNMVSGLREKILDALKLLGFVDGEVFTTDTHAVNAVIFNERGYHPVGEVINHEKLIGYIVEAAKGALKSMEPAKFGYRSILISGVKVIGRKPLEKLCMLTDNVIQAAKRIIFPLFGAAFLGLMLISLYV